MPNKIRFSLFMDHIFPSFITTIHFSILTADNTKNSLPAKIPFALLQDNNFKIKKKIYIHVYKKYSYLFLAPELILHTKYGFGV